MKQLIALCVKRPVSVIMTLAALGIAGAFCAVSLPLDKLPNISQPRVIVETAFPGMNAEEVRAMVTIPVEDALSPVKGLQRIRSVSRSGASVITLDFRWGANAAQQAALVREAIDLVYPALPAGASKPVAVTATTDTEPHIIAVCRSKQGDAVFERRFADYELRGRLRGIEGAGVVMISGGKLPEAKIEIDTERATGRGLDPVTLRALIGAELADVPAGMAREGDKEVTVVSKGGASSYAELGGLIIGTKSGAARIDSLAGVRQGEARQKSVFIADGIEQTALEIYRGPGANPARLSAEVRNVIAEANTLFSRDIEITILYDDAPVVLAGLRDLGIAAFIGAAAVIAVLCFFIRNVRLSMLAALSIVVSMCAALAALALTGRTLNAMSLSGLALGLGLVSDTSVIILEALDRRFSVPGTGSAEAASAAAALSASSFGGAATTAVVFVPVIFLPGPLGELFGDLSITLVAAVMSGWLYAQFALPSLFCLGFRPRRQTSAKPDRILSLYRSCLNIALDHPAAALALAAVLSAGGILLTLTRPAVFVSADAAREIDVELLFPAGTQLEAIAREGEAMAAQLTGLGYFSAVFARAGAEDGDTQRRAATDYQREALLFRCFLSVKGMRGGEDVFSALSAFAGAYALDSELGIRCAVKYPLDKTERLLGLGAEAAFAARGSGPLDTRRQMETAREKLQAMGIRASVFPDGAREEYRVYPQRELMAMAGMNAVDIARQMAQTTEGALAGKLEVDAYPVDIRVTGNYEWGSFGTGAAALSRLPLASTERGVIYLGSIGKIVREETPLALARLDRTDALYLGVSSAGKIDEAKLLRAVPELQRVDESAFKRYKHSLVITLLLVAALLYLTLGAQFESLSLPCVILLSIPFAFAGAGPALALSRSALDSGSAIALVALFGLVVNSGIVLYEISAAKNAGAASARQAVFEGACERLRPVLATTLTTIIVLLPPALAPLGAAQRSMSITMLGGCIASTLLTLFAMPAVFVRFLQKKRR